MERWFPGFGARVVQGGDTVPARRRVTVRHLLTHTAGLATGGPQYDELFDAKTAQDYARGIGNQVGDMRGANGPGWGFGVQVMIQPADGLPAGSFGWNGGTGTQFQADPVNGRIAIIVIPSFPGTPGVSAIRNQFIQEAFMPTGAGPRGGIR